MWRTDRESYIKRFWAKVDKTNDCWLWTNAKGEFGHGRATWFGVERQAHVVSWIIEYGEDPAPLCVLHHCDNPACVRPSHLFKGTKGDNTADMLAKGRHGSQKKTHCVNGHDFAAHGKIRFRGNGTSYRLCLTCKADEQRRRRDRHNSS